MVIAVGSCVLFAIIAALIMYCVIVCNCVDLCAGWELDLYTNYFLVQDNE